MNNIDNMDNTDNIDNIFYEVMDAGLEEGYAPTCKNDEHGKLDCLTSKKIHYDPCELCKTIDPGILEIDKSMGRLLKVKLTLNNICFGKKITVACVIYDANYKIITFKTFTTVLYKHSECENGKCGSLKQQLLFVLPECDICDSLDLNVCIMANYIYPCECSH